jgi:hypothetical protein
MFYPSTFWHTPDWESSCDHLPNKVGYIEDKVLYAGDFDEVNIHLFPRVRTVRIRTVDADHSILQSCGLSYVPGKTAYIYCARKCRVDVESFNPTVFKFNPDGFTRVRNGEYVSWTPQKAISCETFLIGDAIKKWNIEVCYVADLDAIIASIARQGIYFDEQT